MNVNNKTSVIPGLGRASNAIPRDEKPVDAPKANGVGSQAPLGHIDKLLGLWRQGAVHEADLKNVYPTTFNNRFSLYLGQKAFDAMFEDVEAATTSVNVAYYMFIGDEVGQRFADLLIRKAKENVEVNVMVDAIGSKQHPLFPSRAIIDKLEANGVRVFRNHIFSPFGPKQKWNHPDHRKLVIIDGKKAYTGGMNIGKKYVEQMHDWKVRVEGNAAQQMQTEFLMSWVHLGQSLDRTGHKSDEEIKDFYFPKLRPKSHGSRARVVQHIPGEHREIHQDFLNLIREARKSVQIEVPYLTNGEIQEALREAAERQVNVTVILPAKGDNKFTYWAAKQRYPDMIQAGVKIYEYPGFNHGKVLIVDGKKVSIGSSNMDDVALRHVYELNLSTDDSAFTKQIQREIIQPDMKKSRLMRSSDVNLFHRVVGFLLNRIFGRLL